MFDDVKTPPIEDMKRLYNDFFSLKYLGNDIKNKFALISLICILVSKLRLQKPGITYYQVIKKIDESLPEDFVKTLSIICEDFGYGCTEFLDFGIPLKDIPNSIRKIFENLMPF